MNEITNPFLVFAYDSYYPRGGWHDFKGAFESIGMAEIKAFELRNAGYDYADIVDLRDGSCTEFTAPPPAPVVEEEPEPIEDDPEY